MSTGDRMVLAFVACVCVLCATLLVALGKDTTTVIGLSMTILGIPVLTGVGLKVKGTLDEVKRNVNGQLEAARDSAGGSGYTAGYLDALNGRTPQIPLDQVRRVGDLAPRLVPPQSPPAAGGPAAPASRKDL